MAKQNPHSYLLNTSPLTHTHTHTHTCSLTHKHTHLLTHTDTHTHTLAHSRRQELLSAQDRISLMHDKFAMARIQSREVTPSRPSPPDYLDDYQGGTPSPTKMFTSSSGMYLGAQGAVNYNCTNTHTLTHTLTLTHTHTHTHRLLSQSSDNLHHSKPHPPPSNIPQSK